jgi:hypothetical protein
MSLFCLENGCTYILLLAFQDEANYFGGMDHRANNNSNNNKNYDDKQLEMNHSYQTVWTPSALISPQDNVRMISNRCNIFV